MSVLGTYLSILRRQARLIAVLALLIAPLGYLVLSAGRDTWSSSTVLQVGTSSVAEGILGQSQEYQQPQQRLATELEILQSDAVAERAADLLRDGSVPIDADALAERISARPRGVSTLVEVVGTGPDARSAVDVTTAWSQAYIAYRNEYQRAELERVADDLRTRLAAAETELATLEAATDGAAARQRAAALARYETVTDLLERVRLRLSVDSSGVEILSQPTVPTSPEGPLSAPAAAFVALVAALLLGAGAAVVVDLLRDPVRTRDEAQDVALAEIVGELPRPRRRRRSDPVAAVKERNSPVSLAARSLRLRLEQLTAGRFPDLLVVTSTQSDLRDAEWTAVFLAATFGRADQRALLIADERLVDALRPPDGTRAEEDVRLPDRLVARASDLPGVHVAAILSDADDRPGLLDTRSPTRALRESTGLFDVVVLVEPPREGLDTVAPLADAVLVVCTLGETPARQMALRMAHLEQTCEGDIAVSLVRPAAARSLRGEPAESAAVGPPPTGASPATVADSPALLPEKRPGEHRDGDPLAAPRR